MVANSERWGAQRMPARAIGMQGSQIGPSGSMQHRVRSRSRPDMVHEV